MANIFDKFLNSMRLYDDDELEEDTEYNEEPEEAEEAPVRPVRRPQPVYEEAETPPRPSRPAPANRRSNLTAMRQNNRSGNPLMEVSMVRPSSFEDARDICEMLLSGRAVVINMEGVQVDLAQRIIDFASGACYAIDGNLQKISNYIFIVTPNSIELSGDFQSMIHSVTNSSIRFDE